MTIRLEENRRLVLSELEEALGRISPGEFEAFVEELLKERRILVAAVGRVLISMKAWVKRFRHLGLDINFVGSETEQPLGKDDLLIVASSSGETIFPLEMTKIARKREAVVVYIGCSPESSAAKLAVKRLFLAGRTKLAKTGEFNSKQPMSTLFEQQLYLLGDIITLELMRIKGIDEQVLKSRHANME
jgi:6-phospho-3-hexuloisomerase